MFSVSCAQQVVIFVLQGASTCLWVSGCLIHFNFAIQCDASRFNVIIWSELPNQSYFRVEWRDPGEATRTYYSYSCTQKIFGICVSWHSNIFRGKLTDSEKLVFLDLGTPGFIQTQEVLQVVGNRKK